MDKNENTSKTHVKTEDKFPGTSGAWSNAWCMDSHNSTSKEEEGHSEFQDYEDLNTGWDTATF